MATDILVEFKVDTTQGYKWFRWTVEHEGEIFTNQGSHFIYLHNNLNENDVRKFKNSAVAMVYVNSEYGSIVNYIRLFMFLYSDHPFIVKRFESSDGSSYTLKASTTFNTQYGEYYSSSGFGQTTYYEDPSTGNTCTAIYNFQYKSANGWNAVQVVSSGDIVTYYYTWISSPTSYHNFILSNTGWGALTSIIGKSKTYTLAKINTNHINYGDIVTGASESNLDVLTNSSLLYNLIDSVTQDIVDKTKILVNYSIPLANYNYIKLVYKKDAIPDSADDGTAITITQNSTSQEITGINQNGVYWFVIFTDKSTSDPKSFKVTGF